VLTLSLAGVRSVVLIGAHPDDIEIAAGGLMLSAASAAPGLRVLYTLMTGSPDRQAEARAAAAEFLPGADLAYALHALPDGRLPAHWDGVKRALHTAADMADPDLVVCPAADDAHQDHRLIAELVPTVFRDQLILHYEIPKRDGDLGRRTVYLPLADEVARRKVELLGSCYPSQKDRDWWDGEVFLGLARLRGVECGSRYAEAFSATKLRVTFAKLASEASGSVAKLASEED
jgi:LmbE family N-acetylglucosaminyl deacetylase